MNDRGNTSTARKTELFETTPVPRAVLTLAIPTVISSLVMVIYNLADTYFVGMLNDSTENSGVTLAAPVLLAFNAVNNLFGVGASSMMSRALGRRDYETTRRSSAFGFWCALLSGLCFSVGYTAFRQPLLILLGADPAKSAAVSEAVAEYLFWTTTLGATPAILNVVLAYLVRAEGATLAASIGTMSGCMLNIVLDPIFILPWGLGLGAEGAGLATMVSNCFSCAYFFALLIRRRGSTYVSCDPRLARPKREIVLGVCAVGIPASIQNLLNVTGMTVLNNFTSEWGKDAVAAMGIASKLNMIPMYISMGVSQGIMPLVGYNYARGDGVRIRKTIMFAGAISLSFLTATSTMYFLFSDTFVSLFMKNSDVIACGGQFLRGMCYAIPLLCIDFLAVGVFQACGMGAKSLIFAVLRKIVLEIPALVILNSIFPLYGLAYAQLAAEAILAVAAVVVLIPLIRGIGKNKDKGGKTAV